MRDDEPRPVWMSSNNRENSWVVASGGAQTGVKLCFCKNNKRRIIKGELRVYADATWGW
jgi:hypothetical protein